MKDDEIYALYAAGEREKAFNELVKKYGERLYWHIRSFSCSHEDTDDILQDTFVKIWNALPSFRGEARLFTWVWRIATNQVLNHIRDVRLRNFFSPASEVRPYLETLESDPYFNGDDAQKRLLAAIDKLPPKQRMVFVMRYFEELEYKDISEIMHTTVGSLKASYHHAYMKIRKEITGD
ncbi:MAG: RNA polymerase sigma factor [Bacteroidetes bacterium]|uniref:RNA polymerase sigma factor n=1 Tax=Candidatus Cryptobacteroides gallistercoris TaxID=2840765 RepID=A0A940DP17_9BACT|nr:RNA polymerase sigma factor [Candidatus Cryptobacteroides gallistercoris]